MAKATSFTSLGANPYQQEAGSLGLREQELADALLQAQQQSNAGPIQAGVYTIPNFGALRASLEKKRLTEERSNLEKKKLDLQGRYAEEVARQLRSFRKAGADEEIPLAGPTQDGEPLTGKVVGNPRAFRDYLDSPYAEVRARAEAEQKAYDARYMKAAEKASVGSQARANGDLGGLVAPKKYTQINGAIFEEGEDAPPTVYQGVTQERNFKGEMSNVFPGGKRDNVDKSTRIINQGPDKKFGETMMAGMPDKEKAAQAANSAIRGTETALQALQNGARTGFGEQWLQNARTLASGLTGIQFDATTPTGVLAKALAKNVIDELGGLGAQVSDTDRGFMEQAVGGLKEDPKALERILAIRLGALQRAVGEYGEKLETAADTLGPENSQAAKDYYKIDQNTVGVTFISPEAEASYVSARANMPYEQALRIVLESKSNPKLANMKAGVAPGNNAAIKPGDKEARDRAKMEALGLEYIPPIGGR